MSQPIEFREVTSDEEASFLKPGADDALHIVLFCQADSPVVQKARRLVPEVDIPADWDFTILDTDGVDEIANWYGLTDASGMAVISDGSLLTIEYECSVDALRRLIDVAQKQSDALSALG